MNKILKIVLMYAMIGSIQGLPLTAYAGEALFQDHFDQGQTKNWQSRPGSRWIGLEDTQVYRQTVGAADRVAASYIKNLTVTDFTITVKLRFIGPLPRENFGAALRLRSDSPHKETKAYLIGLSTGLEGRVSVTKYDASKNSAYTTLFSQQHTPVEFNQWYKLKVSMQGPKIRVWVDGTQIAEIEDTDGFFPSGAVGLSTYGAAAEFDDVVIKQVSNVFQTNRDVPRAEVALYRDTPTLLINGKPYAGLICALPYPREKVIKDFAKAGIHLYYTQTHLFTPPEETEATIRKIVESDPEAKIILKVAIHALRREGKGKKWLAAHFEEGQYTRVIGGGGSVNTQSIASKVWRQDATKVFDKHLTHLENSPMGKHIIAYQLAQYEGNYMGSFYYDRMPDYSEPMKKAFQKWLVKKYNNDTRRLKIAWNNKKVTFENASIPSVDHRLAGQLSFRSPRRQQQVIDYDTFASQLMSDYIIYFAKRAKQISRGKAAIGIYGGYVLGTVSSGPDWREKGVWSSYQNLGSFAYNKLVDSPYIDYTTSPHVYLYRGPGEPVSGGVPNGTQRLHQKMNIWEDDTRTSIMALFDVSGSCRTLSETIEVFKRNFGLNLTSGSLSWVPGTFFGYQGCDNPDIMASLAKCQEISQKSLDFDRTPNTQVAVFVDEQSYAYMKILSQVTPPLIDELLHNQLRKAGFPFDVYLLSDIKHKDMPDYKLYIFTNVFKIDRETEKAIKAKLAASEKSTALWFYAPGYVSDTGFSTRRISEIVGITINAQLKMGRANVKITNVHDPITEGMELQTIEFETKKNIIGPLFYINDPDATILGEVAKNGKPGFGYKTTGGVTSIYSAAPGITWPYLRNIARQAGVHVYEDTGDIIYANKTFLVIHSASSGKKTIHLPAKSDVYDIYEETLVAEDADQFTIDMETGMTRLFFLGNSDQWPSGQRVKNSGATMDDVMKKNMSYDPVNTGEYFSISLAKHANRLWFKDDTILPTTISLGKQQLAGIPFDLIDPKKNDGKFAVFLRGGERPGFSLEIKNIPVSRKAKSLYFLHTSAWMQEDSSTVLEYIIHYQDQSTVKIPIKAHYEITDAVNGGNFSRCGLGNPDAKVAYVFKGSKRYPECGLYSFRWDNPKPNQVITTIDITTANNTGQAVPAVIAITGEISKSNIQSF